MINRTPEEHRNYVKLLESRNGDMRDSEIMPKLRRVPSPRHAKIADDVKSLLAWRDTIEPEETFQTNFLMPDNDNGPKEKDEPRPPTRDVECEHEMRPSVNELMTAVSSVQFINGVPVKGDPNVKFGKPNKKGLAPFARIGDLHLCTQDHKRTCRDLPPRRGEIINYGSCGKTLQPRDKLGTPKGPARDNSKSNEFYTQLLRAVPSRNLKPLPRHLRQTSASQHSAIPGVPPTRLALARAREWCGLPPAPANDNRAALPWRPASARDLFMGGRTACKPTEVIPRNDPEVRLGRSQTASAASAPSIISQRDHKVLDAALTACGFADIGNTLGFNGKNAERRGKEALIAATQTFSQFLRKNAA